MTSVSFIVCALNEEKYIGGCVKSINDSMKYYEYPYEIVVVDNGSEDQTWLKACANNVKVVYEPKRGIGIARQVGFDNSRYEYCAFLDADSRLPSGWLETALNAFDEDKEVVAVSGSLQFYDAPKHVNLAARHFYKVAKAFHTIYPTLQGGNYIIKRDTLEAAENPFNSQIEYWGEDTWTATQVAKEGKIKLEPKLVMQTSARRFAQDGFMKTIVGYIVTYFTVNMFHRPFITEYKNFR